MSTSWWTSSATSERVSGPPKDPALPGARSDLRVLGVHYRDGRWDVAPTPQAGLQAGDAVVLSGSRQALEELSWAE